MVDEFSGLTGPEAGPQIAQEMQAAAEITESAQAPTSGIGEMFNRLGIQIFAPGYLNKIVEAAQNAPPGERFQAVNDVVQGGIFPDGDIERVFSIIEQTGNRELQEALGNTFANNENFPNYLLDKVTSGDGNSMFSPDQLNGFLNSSIMGPAAQNALTGILTEIGNNPTDDSFIAEIDEVIGAFDEFQAAQSGGSLEEKRAAKDNLIRSIQAAGGDIPGLARLDGPMVMQFLNDIVNGGANFAINNMIENLQLSPEEAEAFQRLMVPLAPFIEFIAEPYAEWAQAHGHKIPQSIVQTAEDIDTLSGTNYKEAVQNVFDTASISADSDTRVASLSGGAVNGTDVADLGSGYRQVATLNYADLGVVHDPKTGQVSVDPAIERELSERDAGLDRDTPAPQNALA